VIPEQTIQRIAEASPIEQVIGEYFPLKKSGPTYKSLCPFHAEKTPSFTVSPTRGTFKCFGCGAGGSVFRFVMQYESLTFPEAVRKLGEKCGIRVEGEATPKEEAEMKYRRQMKSALITANEFYLETLLGPVGAAARKYLKGRGFNGDICKRWGVGLAPDGWTATFDFMKEKGIAKEILIGCGLVIEKDGRFYDRFRNRIMFAIRNESSDIVGYSGREIPA
jgi:DNA primase